MEVYSDFFVYESGVYHRTNVVDPLETGFHSVKIIGWGQERGIPYWVSACPGESDLRPSDFRTAQLLKCLTLNAGHR